MNRRTFISTSTAAAVALGTTMVSTSKARLTDTTNTSTQNFWPDNARLVISVSMQFEAGAQPERVASSPFPPLDPKYPDLPVRKWYEYG